MNRIKTMSRFEEPSLAEIGAYCCECCEALEIGQEVIKFEDEHFCDLYCFTKYYDVKEVILSR